MCLRLRNNVNGGVKMELVYAALLLHSLGKKVDEAGIKKIMEAVGAKPDEAQVKALVSSLKDVNIDEAIKQTSIVQPQEVEPTKKEEKEEPKKEEKKAEEKIEEAAEGLGALFG
jgi:large subunit ribosomal protein L12